MVSDTEVCVNAHACVCGSVIECVRECARARMCVSPCAAHYLRPVEGERIIFVWDRSHLVGFCQQCVCEEFIGLKVEF